MTLISLDLSTVHFGLPYNLDSDNDIYWRAAKKEQILLKWFQCF
jgi:hypothetical protein